MSSSHSSDYSEYVGYATAKVNTFTGSLRSFEPSPRIPSADMTWREPMPDTNHTGSFRPRVYACISGELTDKSRSSSPPPRCCGGVTSFDEESLRDVFPWVSKSLMTAVADHELAVDELYLLDQHRSGGKWRQVSFDPYGQEIDTSLADYPTLHAVLDPLTTYFGLLIGTRKNVKDLQETAVGAQRYIAILAELAAQYEWRAVLAYHLDFHRAQLRAMRHGNHFGWADLDYDLHRRHFDEVVDMSSQEGGLEARGRASEPVGWLS